MHQFNVSIIVPVLNEGEQASALINRLLSLKEYSHDILIVDGGSTDGSVEKFAAHFKVINSEKGRAKQMNVGARHAKGSWLVFVHADTEFKVAHLKHMVDQSSQHQWGRFNVTLDAKGLSFRVIEWFINVRSRLTGVATGDQCIFTRTSFFKQLNGFADIPLMEDVHFSKQAKLLAKPKCLAMRVKTSARRWQTFGVMKTVFLMWKLRLLYWYGVEPDILAKMYR